jgi:hypothetical protein
VVWEGKEGEGYGVGGM